MDRKEKSEFLKGLAISASAGAVSPFLGLIDGEKFKEAKKILVLKNAQNLPQLVRHCIQVIIA